MLNKSLETLHFTSTPWELMGLGKKANEASQYLALIFPPQLKLLSILKSYF